jgi:hypothetical protein
MLYNASNNRVPPSWSCLPEPSASICKVHFFGVYILTLLKISNWLDMDLLVSAPHAYGLRQTDCASILETLGGVSDVVHHRTTW